MHQRCRIVAAGAIVVCTGAAACVAQVPEYKSIELQARANFVGAFNLPNSTFFNSATTAIDDDANVAMRLSPVQSTRQGVWYGGGGAGSIVYITPEDGFVSDVSMNNLGKIVTSQTFTSPTAIFLIDAIAMTSSIGVAPGGFFGLTSLASAEINDAGVISIRGFQAIGGQAHISDLAGSQARHVAEVGAEPSSPYSFLFTPTSNNNRQIASKARLGALNQTGESQPDQIRVWNADGSSVLIAEDRDSNIASPYFRFDNSVSLNDNGWVAFNATLAGNARGVFLSDGTTTIEIASTVAPASRQISELEFFRPDVNNSGLVVFRGRDVGGVQSVFVGDGVTLHRLVGRGDTLTTDLGPGWVEQNDNSPVFGGSPNINNRGDVVFNATLTPVGDTQIEWGTGVFVAYASSASPADLDGDGAVGASDLAILLGSWGVCPGCPADLDGDGSVSATDLAILLGSWG